MTPEPGVLLAAVAASLACALAIVIGAVTLARAAGSRLDGWCGRHGNRFVASLATADDAALPESAKKRARALLLAHLDARQRRSWHLRRRFDVTAPSGRRYTIGAYRPFNIRADDAVFCLAVEAPIPVCDKVLAQKLLIETGEQAFLAEANIRTFSSAWLTLVDAARARSGQFSVEAPGHGNLRHDESVPRRPRR